MRRKGVSAPAGSPRPAESVFLRADLGQGSAKSAVLTEGCSRSRRRFRCARRPLRRAAAAIGLALGAASLWAQSEAGVPAGGGLPRLTPDPYAVELGSTSGPLSVGTLIHAALVLSGADAPTIASDTMRLDESIARLSREVAPLGDPYRRGGAVLAYMHAHLLTSYDATQARLDSLLATGRFNCVSSAVLYLILGRAVGLGVEGAYTPDHAFCTVNAGGRLVDVETTNRFGFDPGTKKAFRDAFGETGFTYVPPGDYLRRGATDGRGLLAFILQDRMALLEQQGNFAAAVGLAVDRYALLRTQAAFIDGANEMANYCSALNNQGRYAEALAFVSRAVRSYGSAPVLLRAAGVLAENETATLAKEGAFSEALRVIHEGQDEGWIDDAAAASLRATVAEHKLLAEAKGLPFEEAVAAATRSYRAGELPQSFYRDYLVSLYAARAKAVAGSGDYLRAATLLGEGERLVGDGRLAQGREIYLGDYAATIHNRFAALYNAGNAGAAIPLLKEGLAKLPGNPMLTSDLRAAEQAAGSPR